ncbi:HpcH/HpaI aldolase family protein [Tropicimonas sediminicola]|uniref:2-keto-3-deoxy-L-rhamnonate aldolase RhmA n=1 Tax=Tropicimonas sediminicola TaxID=1031541 RepID=A0A239J6N0_9RHOB|nr:aldolase/citrate lyase family protein [Tropicimonas sediminicola]SNT01475.1 2-keto-3-deoxy-L-rhamnonate aldolase RhmA [Tropicimonas sediminicola]
MTVNSDFKARLSAGQEMLGVFVKTPQPIIIEILGQSGLDFMVIDAEHAPFDREAIDTAMIAGRAAGCPILVRVPKGDPETILGVLDSGAAGVMVPHVCTAEQAAALAKAVRYGPGGRGFAGTTRAADYARRGLQEHFDRTAGEVSLICQIEDPEGYENFRSIASVDGVDALFVGRADLSVSYGLRDFFARETADRCAEILGAKGAATGLYCAPNEDVAPWRRAGGSLFVIGSDHTLMTRGVAQMREAVFGSATSSKGSAR